MVFQFRFAALLKQRRYELRQAQSELGRAQRSYEESLHAERCLSERIEREKSEWQREQSCGMTVARHLMARDYVDRLERELAGQTAQSAQRARELTECKAHLLECEKKVKMLESMEDKELQNFKHTLSQMEQRSLDEMTILRTKAR